MREPQRSGVPPVRRSVTFGTIVVLLAASLTAIGVAPAAATAREFVRSWGNPPLQPGDLDDPHGIAIDATGRVFVLDETDGWVQEFDQDGTFVQGWAAPGGRALAVSPTTGNLFVVHGSQCRVTEYTSAGSVVRTFGSCAPGDDQLETPLGVAVAADGTVYVVDTGTDQLHRFSSGGQSLPPWPLSKPNVAAVTVGTDGLVHVGFLDRVDSFTAGGAFVRSFTGSSQSQVIGMATGPDGSVYVTDTNGNRIKKYTAAGTFVTQWGGGQESSYPGSFHAIRSVAVAPGGDVFVVDERNEHIQRFTDTGAFVDDWGTYTRDGRLRSPAGVATDAAGNVYVAETKNHQVQVFDAEGNFVRKWRHAAPGDLLDSPVGIDVAPNGDVYVASAGDDRVERYTSDGEWLSSIGVGQFTWPTSLALGGNGHLYVSDTTADRIKEFDATGTLVRSWGGSGDGDGRFSSLWGVAVGADGSVYAVDRDRPRVQQFSATGTFIRSWGTEGTGPGELAEPRGIETDATGDVYVTDCATDRVERFGPDGTHLATTGGPGSGEGQFRCPAEVAFAGTSMYVTDDDTTEHQDRVQQFAYPSTAVVAVALTADSTDVAVGDTVQFEVTIDNLSEQPLTGLSTTSPSATDCARTLPDLAPLTSVTLDCQREATGADLPRFAVSVTVHADQAEPTTSNEAVIDVSHMNGLVLAREWAASETGLFDSDPIAPPGPGHGGQGLAVDGAGRVFVVGSRDHPEVARVARFGTDGVFEQQWGAAGQGDGDLWYPDEVALGPSGEVYTTECTGLHRVQRFAPDGTPDHAWAVPTGPGGACSPADVAVAPDGTAYVTNASSNRVDRISGSTYEPGWGTPGTGPGEFDEPRGVAVGPDGSVYVVDGGNHRVQRFSATGEFLGAWGTQGYGNGRFVDPRDLAVSDEGFVVVADFGDGTAGRRVQVFDADGTFLSKVAVRTEDVAVHSDPAGNVHLYVYPYDGDDPLGLVREYVAPGGPYLTASLTPAVAQVGVGATVDYELIIENVGQGPLTGVTVGAGPLSGCDGPADDLLPGASTTLTCTARPDGGDLGRFRARATVDTDQTERFVTDNTGIEVLAPVVGHWGWDRLQSPRGLVANWQGDLFVADCAAKKVLHYRTDGQYVGSWGAAGTGEGQFSCPIDITINSAGNLLVADAVNRDVQEFTATGTFVRGWDTGTNVNYGDVTALDTDEHDGVHVADHDDGFYGPPCQDWGDFEICTQYPPNAGNNVVRRFGADGSPVGQWSRTNAFGVAATRDDRLLVTGSTGIEVRTFDGTLVTTFSRGAISGRVAVDRHDNIWVTHPADGLVAKYTPGGHELGRWSIAAVGDIAFDRDHAYVLANGAIVKLGTIAAGRGAVKGTVTDAASGQPVPGAQVALLGAADFAPEAGGTADENGAFRAEAPPGDYFLYTMDPSGQHQSGLHGAPTPVTITDAGSATAHPVLVPTRGAVEGTLVEDGADAPLEGAWVIALDATTGAPQTGAATDAAGHYRLGGLTVGDHLLAFVDPAGGHVAEFHGDSPTAEGSLPVTITAGGTAGADGSLATQPPNPGGATLQGEVRGLNQNNGSRPLANSGVFALSAADYSFAGAALTDDEGRYTLDVAPGDYRVMFIDGLGQHGAEWHDDRPYHQLAGAAAVTAPGTVDAGLARHTASIVSASARDGATGQDLAGVWVIAIGADGVAGSCTTGGPFVSCSVTGLAPGPYRVLYLDPTGAHAPEYWRERLYPDDRTVVSLAAGQDNHHVPILLGP